VKRELKKTGEVEEIELGSRKRMSQEKRKVRG